MLTRTPRLRFIDPPEATPATVAPEPTTPPTTTPPVTPPGTPEVLENGFPAGTSWQDMTGEQQIAYWKFHARKHERTALAKDAELEAERAKSRTDEEKQQDEIRRQGEASGAARFVGEAVHGQLRALTGKSDEDLASALEFVDVSRFVKDGSLDRDRLKAFAAQLGTAAPAAPTNPTNPLATAVGTLSPSGAPGAPRSGGSINADRKALAAQFAARVAQ